MEMDGAQEGGLGLIVKLPVAQCPQFLHKVIDGVCGRAKPRFQDYGSIWNLREWMEVLDSTTAFIKCAVGKDEGSEEISCELSRLNPEYQDVIIKCLKGRKPEIKDALVEKVCAMSSSYLQDFDWQLKLAMSSDKLSTLQMPLVNLDLDIVENGAIAPVSIEMNKEELQNLISSLEAANKVVLQLK
ncbi:COMM domain-containing protein 8 [Dendropsophus ebraccatus]|uniref:COMM domain-containing protein 8 n=1 Tax=Dendropsophus ebraccatus TaxID=150705 RepID=UPI0038316770